MVLTRTSFTSYGVFGELIDDDNNTYDTLEHAYPTGEGFAPKLPPGVYVCKRGTHQLHESIPFETFEITGVPGHSGILFHVGNYNSNSDGCVLLGLGVDHAMITHSKTAFAQFMAALTGIHEFCLEVR